jgi:hypothetical protein
MADPRSRDPRGRLHRQLPAGTVTTAPDDVLDAGVDQDTLDERATPGQLPGHARRAVGHAARTDVAVRDGLQSRTQTCRGVGPAKHQQRA